MEQKQEKVVIETPTKKGRFLFYFGLFLVYLIGLGVVLVNKPEVKIQTISSENVSATGTPPVSKEQNKINPPSLALTGNLNIITNNVEKLARFKEDWEKVATSGAILQEEKIKTDETGKAEIEFPDQLNIAVNPKSEIYLVNLLPEAFLIEQFKGIVEYDIKKPISIKSIDTLSLFEPGKAVLQIDPESGFIYMDIASGSAKLSFIDNDNQTQVYDIEKGDRVIYNPENTSIIIK